MAGEKTEKATPKRKQDERKKGNVFLSREVVTVFSLLSIFAVLKFLMPFIVETLEGTITGFFTMLPTVEEISAKTISEFFIDGLIAFVKTAMPLLLTTVLTAVLLTMLQTKMLFSSKAFAFKGNRINPLSGLKKMFSMRGFVELLKSILKIIVLLYIVYSVIKDEILLLPRLMDGSFYGAMQLCGSIIADIALTAGMFFVALAAADYLYQWWEYEKNLRMSKQEIKDEYKQVEGDPKVKGRQRSIQQQRARRRMMQDVPKADVVIRNPTHFAVAIKYDKEVNRAPMVLAKGADGLALRIIEVAQANNVFITENKALARALFEATEVGQEVPEAHYQAIAEVLAFVYSLQKKDLT